MYPVCILILILIEVIISLKITYISVLYLLMWTKGTRHPRAFFFSLLTNQARERTRDGAVEWLG